MSTFFKVIYFFFFLIIALVLLRFFLALALFSTLLLWLRTWQMKKEPNQQDFLMGKFPNPKPDGFYHGTMGFESGWMGKKFNAETSTGINILKNKKGQQYEKYPFKTFVGEGLFDEKLVVLKLDYNIKGNPFWIRPILDEIVEIAPGEYLGKMHIRLIPGFPFSVLYFTIKK